MSTLDVKEAVRILSSSNTILDGSEDTLLKLQEKHPSIHPNRKLPLVPEGDDGGYSTQVSWRGSNE